MGSTGACGWGAVGPPSELRLLPKGEKMTHETVSQFARIRSLLASIEDPAWIVHPEGRVLYRNEAAATMPTTPLWVTEQVLGHSGELPIGARIRRIQIDGRARLLVLGRPTSTLHEDLDGLGLDDLHVETAEFLVHGFSDLEIGLLLGKPIGIVHSLIVQVHRQLGVRTRVELIDFVRRFRRLSQPPPADHRTRPTLEARPSAVFALQGVEERRAKAR